MLLPSIQIQQDSQCTCNVILRCVPATIVVVEKKIISCSECVCVCLCVCLCVCVCVCSLRHPACNAHAPYCHLWPAPLYSISSHYLINDTIFEKKFTEHKMCCVLIVSINTV